MASHHVDREPRFPVPAANVVNVEVVKQDCQAAPQGAGKLVDLARGGAKLLLNESLPLDDVVELRLHCDYLNLDLRMTAAVCWCQPEKDKWALGCRFVPPLPPDTMERLFVTGLLERRFFQRHPRRVAVRAQWEMEAGFLPATLWDLSDGGFCLLMPVPRTMGGRVLVLAGDEPKTVTVPAKVQWEMRVPEGYLAGCQFINRRGHAALRSVPAIGGAPQPAPKTADKSKGKRRLRDLVGALLHLTSDESSLAD